MAVPGQVAGSGAPATCGLESILEALQLLLSPGGERTDLGAGLTRDSQGRQSSRAALPSLSSEAPGGFVIVRPASFYLRKPKLKEGMGLAEH